MTGAFAPAARSHGSAAVHCSMCRLHFNGAFFSQDRVLTPGSERLGNRLVRVFYGRTSEGGVLKAVVPRANPRNSTAF